MMERWKLNLYTLWITQIFSLSSFGLVIPFMSFYIQELGITDDYRIKLYTGILTFAPAVTMAVASPVWGIIGDKYGRKLMILRAMFAASIIIGGMGLVTQVWQLVVLRGVQGLFTGTATASNAFVAANIPENRLSKALGFMSSSNFIGLSAGPLIGGLLADSIGIRFSFFAGAALMFIGFLMVLFLLKEDKSDQETLSEDENKGDYKSIISSTLLSLLFLLFIIRITRTIFTPFIPIYVQVNLGTRTGAAGITGIISGFVGVATAIAGLTITQLGDKKDKQLLIKGFLLISILFSIPLYFLENLDLFIVIYGMMYFFIGGVEPIIFSLTAQNTPVNKRGALFGIQGLVSSLGWLCAPIIGTYISVRFSITSILIALPIVLSVGLLTVKGQEYIVKRKN